MLMKYKSPFDIGVGDVVTITEDGHIQEFMVLINYIKGQTDKKGYTPDSNFTVLTDNYGNRVMCHDYRIMEVLV